MVRPKGLPTHCTVEGCDRVCRARGLCAMHYYRLRAGAPIAGDERSHGERHGNAKLSADNVLELRKLHDDGASFRALAEKFGVSNVAVYNAISGKTWRHLH